MSTKNLARTVIEGGRDSGSRGLRRLGNAKERACARGILRGVVSGGDAEAIAIPRHRVYSGFDDKLAPVRRWLASHVGRRWNSVRSELFQRFDIRTTAGRHIVFCHMFPWVEDDRFAGWKPFRVDRHGILREAGSRPRYVRAGVRAALPRGERELELWLAGRRVGARGPGLFWFLPTEGDGHRQHHRLTDEDAALWRSLPDWFRARHVPGAPPPDPTRSS